jgi:hypothetical protein
MTVYSLLSLPIPLFLTPIGRPLALYFPMGAKKKARPLRPYQKVMEWLAYYEKKCVMYDVPIIDTLKEIYEPIIVKRGRRLPQLLQLAEQDIDPTHLRPLIDSFQESLIQIRFLSMLRTNSGDDGLHVVAHALGPPLELTGLAYHSNNAGPSGCRALARGMVASKSLAVLELDFNPGISDAGVESLVHYGHCPAMNKLSLRFCEIGDDGAAAIGRWIAREDSKVKEILLNGNRIGPPGAAAIGHGLAENKSIVRLDIGDNLFGYDAECLNAIHDGIVACPTFQALNALNHFDSPEGIGQKFLELTQSKPLGECVLSVKMDTFIFQNMRQLSMANKKKIAKEEKKKRLAEKKAAKAASSATLASASGTSESPSGPRTSTGI